MFFHVEHNISLRIIVNMNKSSTPGYKYLAVEWSLVVICSIAPTPSSTFSTVETMVAASVPVN
jgi:hypothetical protein